MTAQEILDANAYMTLATADADGVPWASPVWFARAGDELFWISYEHRRHSRNIAARPQVAIVVFDSTVTPGDAKAVYIEATAARLQIFRARVTASWTLDDRDNRIAAPIR